MGGELCEICGDAPILAKGRCRACYNYWRRTGLERDVYLVRQTRRREAALDRAYAVLAASLQITGA